MYCIECGAAVPDKAKFCAKCGTRVYVDEEVIAESVASPPKRQETPSVSPREEPKTTRSSTPVAPDNREADEEALWMAAIGPNHRYYLRQVYPKERLRFNWVGFFIPMLWLPYRKLWGPAAALLLFWALAPWGWAWLASLSGVFRALVFFVAIELVIRVMVGLEGNNLLRERWREEISRAKSEQDTSRRTLEDVAYSGGVSWAGVVGFFFGYIVVGFVSSVMLSEAIALD